MMVRLLLAALAAGLIAGLAMTPAQYLKVVPLILAAESYEDAAAPAHGHEAGATGGDTVAHDHPVPSSGFGLERLGKTVLANLAAGGGFALLLAGAALVSGIAFPKGRDAVVRGLILGAAGWISVQLAPGFGLPPELPGFPYVDLAARQAWWVSTVALTAIGLYLLALRPGWPSRAAGVVLMAAPHLYGAPRPEDLTSSVPAFLASEYTAAALATTLFFWLVLGGFLGLFLSQIDDGGETA